MRLLHVGSGFRPWRRGGLVAYTEDLMDEQLRRGDEPSYFFSGRMYPLLRGPRLRRWSRRGIAMLELVNSPLYDHGRQPQLETSEPRVERLFARVLEEVRPDAVHVHELAGLPFSILDAIRASGAASIVTLQDYFPVCSTFKLLDHDGRVCTRLEIGADCMATTAADPRIPGLMFYATARHHLRAAPPIRWLPAPQRDRLVARASRRIADGSVSIVRRREPSPRPTPEAFQRRREQNVERLSRCDRVIAMSSRVAEIYTRLGVDPQRVTTMQLTLAHIERLGPRRIEPAAPLTFATLAGFESEAKGARVLLGALRLLEDEARAGRFRLLVYGTIDPHIAREAEGTPGLEIGARFRPTELDSVLDRVHVGLMPSIWEEAYGYAGMEFLAKGIPVIANAIGGMIDYTREGETGWLNRSCGAEELARIMRGLIERPKAVAELNAKLLANRDAIVKPLARHADEMQAVYEEALASGRRTA